MTLSDQTVKNIINKLLKGSDYRIEVVSLINAEFLEFAITFFKQIVNAKINNENIGVDWYMNAFLRDPKLTKKQVAIHSGLNLKTIRNMYNTTKKEVVIDASFDHYEVLYDTIKDLVDLEEDFDLVLTIKLNGVSVDLNVSESLIVINTLAVKRATIRGGLWSTAGKRVEKPLMIILCELFEVPKENYESIFKSKSSKKFNREVDFYLLNDKKYKCEVKLMGGGNPEGADVVIARDSSVFVADKLSDTNKSQLDSLKMEWVELRSKEGFRKFKTVLEKLDIPHKGLNDNKLDDQISQIIDKIMQ